MQKPTVETDRLILRRFSPDDLDSLSEILSRPEVMRYMPGGEPYPRERSARTLQSIIDHWEQHGFGWWAICWKRNPQLIGWCGLSYLEELDETEVAFLMNSQFWGRGVATEGAHASLRYGFEELGLDRIIALAHVKNFASRRVMEKNGLTYREDLHLWGLELAKYAIERGAFRPNDSRFLLHK